MSTSIRFRSEDVRSKITIGEVKVGIEEKTYVRGTGIFERNVGLEHEVRE